MEGKKIIIVTRNMNAGGAERVIAQLANYFVEKKVKCKIITTDLPKISYELDERISLEYIGMKSKNKLVDRILRYWKLRKMILFDKPSIVLSMPEDTAIYVLLSLLGSNIPVYVSERNNPWVMPDSKITRMLRTILYPFAKGIIFQTNMAKEFFSEGIQEKGIVLKNPIDDSRIPQPYKGIRKKIIVGAGRLNTQKNFPLLINAFTEFSNKHPDYRLVIYGEGQERENLENLIKSLQMENKIELPGRCDNLLNVINNASMFVLSSDYEGMPNVLLEAMCMGMPVISTDCPSGGPRDLIQDNFNGILIPVNDKDEVIRAMAKLTNDMVAKRLGNEAFLMRKNLTDNSIFQQWYNYLFFEK